MGDVTDFSADVKQMTLDMNLTDSGLDVHGVTKLQAAKSVAALLLLAHPDRSDAPPPEFFKLPGDADIAAFSRGSDPVVWKHPLQLAGDAVASILQSGGITEADAKAIETALVDGFTPTDGPSLSAHGIDSALVTKAQDAYVKVASGDDAKKAEPLRQLVEARTGWWVISHSEDATSMNGRMKELAAAWNKPSVAKAWKAKLPMIAIPKLHTGGAVAGAPAGTQHYVLELTPMTGGMAMGMGMGVGSGKKEDAKKPAAKAAPGKPLVLHFMIVPDGAKSWMAVGGDEASALAHVKSAMAGGDGSLATRPGLDKLKNGKMTNGGFFDARGLFGGSPMMAWLTGHDRRLATADAAAKPGTPIVYSLAPSGPSADAPAGTSTLDMTVPASAISETTKAAFTAFSHR